MLKSEVKVINNVRAAIFSAKDHGFVGVSPFNSYFIEEHMLLLFEWAIHHFKSVSIFLPDVISIHTLKAIGYTAERAAYKTRRQDAYLRNKVIRTLNKLNVSQPSIDEMVVTLSSLKNNDQYIKSYQDCLNKFETISSFREGCFSTSEWILSNYLSTNNITDAVKAEAVKYFLFELPLFLNSPTILKKNSSSFIYHSMPEYLNQLFIENKYVESNQNFIVAKIQNAIVAEGLV